MHRKCRIGHFIPLHTQYTHIHTQLEASASHQYGTKTAPLYTNGATPHKPADYVAPVSPNFPIRDKRYVSAPKLDDMDQDTFTRTLLPSLGDLPDHGEYVMAGPPPSDELVPGNSGYEYLNEEGQRRVLLKVSI